MVQRIMARDDRINYEGCRMENMLRRVKSTIVIHKRFKLNGCGSELMLRARRPSW